MTKKVLHVDDDPEWSRFVREALAPVKGIRLLSFTSLTKAKEAAESGGIVLFIVDGSIDEKGDGWAWAESLRKEGSRAYVLSAVLQNLSRFLISKLDFTREKFRAIVLEILGI